jgi:hypothetical protein
VALQAGATNGNPSDLQPASERGGAKPSFQGTGRTLSGAAPQPQAPSAPAPPAPVTHTITFFTNGACAAAAPRHACCAPTLSRPCFALLCVLTHSHAFSLTPFPCCQASP